MARKMQVNRLDKDELEYLLNIRGVALGTCDEMRKRLSSAIRLEYEGDSVKFPPYPYTFEADQLAIQKKFDDVAKLVDDLWGDKKSSEAQKLLTKMAYIMERIEHMETKDEAGLNKIKSELLACALTLLDQIHEKIENFEKKQVGPVPAALSLLESQVGAQTFQTGIHEAPGSSPIRNIVASGSGGNKTIPPHKWEFSGDPKSTSVHAFFEQVEELRSARNVTEDTLLEAGIDLFVDKAYQFYKDCRKRVTSWNELVSEFKEEYLSANHNDLLFDELRKRTQHSSETIGVYLAVMSSYFNRLGCRISEEAKLSIVIKNLHPYYQDRLRDPLPTTMSELRTVCRRMEARRDLMNSYVEPSSSRRSHFLEKDLAYIGTTEDLDTVEAATISQPSGKPKEIVCFKCKKPGHKAIGCAELGPKRCFKCNREGYTVRTCPNCTTQGNEGGRT